MTFYRTRQDANEDNILDGTHNASQRAIGGWIEERYRTMWGYQRQQSVLNVSRLIAYSGNHLAQGVDLTHWAA
ncbi:hypothetical protein [uncultured Thermanaerothrix sp.]|uniref:hypothetical protein n=1 Tax=uncultured Thermanaerothrix sp. TaxID=1195149 RepID=UPI0026159303|nr:hypothetical protein [uncultured Thermanaerothrix sp.]